MPPRRDGEYGGGRKLRIVHLSTATIGGNCMELFGGMVERGGILDRLVIRDPERILWGAD
jgi:hypothetical protein